MQKNRKHDGDCVFYDSTCMNKLDGTQTAKLKEHLTSVHVENMSKDKIFSCEESSIRKRQDTFKTWICYFTNRILEHPIKLLV
jgi:hypothetical protein